MLSKILRIELYLIISFLFLMGDVDRGICNITTIDLDKIINFNENFIIYIFCFLIILSLVLIFFESNKIVKVFSIISTFYFIFIVKNNYLFRERLEYGLLIRPNFFVLLFVLIICLIILDYILCKIYFYLKKKFNN